MMKMMMHHNHDDTTAFCGAPPRFVARKAPPKAGRGERGRFEKMKDVDPYCCVCFIIITMVLFFA